MRLLLLSDTHGDLSLINELAKKVNAEAVIHAGDFGFYDKESVHRLSERELHLMLVHSDKVSSEAKRRHYSHSELKKAAIDYNLLGDFSSFISGEQEFSVPVYAVWGNHEDKNVVEQLRAGLAIKNLHLLDERRIYEIGGMSLFGLGGNILPGQKMFDRAIAGYGGKIWSTLDQIGALLAIAESDRSPTKIFVSHVSPGKEPLLIRMMLRIAPNFMISGHMGTPFTSVWNQFAIHPTENSFFDWLDQNSSGYNAIWNLAKKYELTENQQVALNHLAAKKFNRIKGKRGVTEPEFLRKMWVVNLPDAKVGHSVLVADNGHCRLER